MARKETTRRNGGRGEVSFEDLERQLNALKSDVSELSSTMVALANDRKDAALTAGTDRIDALMENGREMAARLEDRFDSLRGEVESSVRGKPFATIGIAAAVGLVVGYLSARRK